MTEEIAEELFRQVAAFASFGFAKIARGGVRPDGLRVVVPQAVLPGPVPRRADQRPADGLLPGRGPRQRRQAPRRRASCRSTSTARPTRPRPSGSGGRGGRSRERRRRGPDEPLPEDAGIERRPAPGPLARLRRSRRARRRERWAAESAVGWGVRLGLRLVKGIGEEHEELLDRRAGARAVRLAGGRRRADRAAGGDDRADDPGRGARLARPAAARAPLAAPRGGGRDAGTASTAARRRGGGVHPGRRTADGPAPAGDRRRRRCRRSPSRSGSAMPTPWSGSMPGARWSTLFRPALDRLGAVTNAALDDRRPGPVRIGGLVVTRQHPMTAKGTVFLALEDETGMVNVTLWPDTWARLRGVVRRHALLLVDGDLQREVGWSTSSPTRSGRCTSRGRARPAAPRRAPAGVRAGVGGRPGMRAGRSETSGRVSGGRPLGFCGRPLAGWPAGRWRPRRGLDERRKRRYQAAPRRTASP